MFSPQPMRHIQKTFYRKTRHSFQFLAFYRKSRKLPAVQRRRQPIVDKAGRQRYFDRLGFRHQSSPAWIFIGHMAESQPFPQPFRQSQVNIITPDPLAFNAFQNPPYAAFDFHNRYGGGAGAIVQNQKTSLAPKGSSGSHRLAHYTDIGHAG